MEGWGFSGRGVGVRHRHENLWSRRSWILASAALALPACSRESSARSVPSVEQLLEEVQRASRGAAPHVDATPRTRAQVMAEAPPVGHQFEAADAAWRRWLSPERYRILRQEGTERAFSHPHHRLTLPGTWVCAGCGNPLFASEHKYDSGTGWPSFWQPIEAGRVGRQEDRRHGMVRTEVHCARCQGHLGHVFPDGPEPTGQRYCINGVAMVLIAEPH